MDESGVREVWGEKELAYLGTVNKLSQRNISMMIENMDILERRMRSILEPHTEEIPNIRGRTTAELNSNRRRKLRYPTPNNPIVRTFQLYGGGKDTYEYPAIQDVPW
jgi:hypothetical protein